MEISPSDRIDEMSAPRMGIAGREAFEIDGRDYLVSISAARYDAKLNVVPMRVTFRAQFGTRSVCLVRGITNQSFYESSREEMKKRISITPKVVCEMIRAAHRAGWDPEGSRTNFEWIVDREVVRTVSESWPKRVIWDTRFELRISVGRGRWRW
jgi:hypothetical protein